MPQLRAREASGEKVEDGVEKRQPKGHGVEDIEGVAWDAEDSTAGERHA